MVYYFFNYISIYCNYKIAKNVKKDKENYKISVIKIKTDAIKYCETK